MWMATQIPATPPVNAQGKGATKKPISRPTVAAKRIVDKAENAVRRAGEQLHVAPKEGINAADAGKDSREEREGGLTDAQRNSR